MLRTSLAATAVLTIALAAGSAHADWRHHSHHPTGQSGAGFVNEMEDQMQSSIASIHTAVSEGRLPPSSLQIAYSDRNMIRNEMQAASADGVITRGEDAHIRDMVNRLTGRAWGGGPVYYDHYYHHHHHY